MIFPTYVVYTDHKSIVNTDLIEKSKFILKTYSDKPFLSPCISTVKTKDNILDVEEFSPIKNAVVQTVFEYCKKLHIKTENLVIKSSWINFYDVNGYQDLHNHNNSVLSGVFYIKSEEARDLVFQAPYHFQQPVNPKIHTYTIENCNIVDFPSKIGRCYVFPSHLLHQTLPAKSERISLSFNINYID